MKLKKKYFIFCEKCHSTATELNPKVQKPTSNEKNDLYSLGITLYEIWFGNNDYEQQNVAEDPTELFKFHSKKHEEIKKKKIEVEKNPIGKIIYGLLEIEESKRISLEDITEILKSTSNYENEFLPSDDLMINQIKFEDWKLEQEYDIPSKNCDGCRRFLDTQKLFKIEKKIK